ncbi:DUF1707 domain-containing protein [Micromonospora sp. WMMD882]|uniref:DUF1707 SHOCT-like domain-containing protein n=1 Tax=Micromonospora sp. WMMD882 TaxID=3015151 RepID=UPI00248AB231|nr:DUF1707 domain-containing protein [Micromonospora sp. WMMD882]WBB81120.1 DUF1707 domain-containing protein [Micromonospora sp. WMMD882]
MSTADDRRPDLVEPPGIRIGTPERRAAKEALEEHHDEDRLDDAELARRVTECERAGTRAELLRLFADLPLPHPELPPVTPARPGADDDFPPIAQAVFLTLTLGLPVAVVLGIVNGAWWALAVPVAVTVVMTYVEHLRGSDRPR